MLQMLVAVSLKKCGKCRKDFDKNMLQMLRSFSNVAETLIDVANVQGFPRLGEICAVELVRRADRDNLQSFMPFKLRRCSLIMQLWMGFRTTQVGKLSMVWTIHW